MNASEQVLVDFICMDLLEDPSHPLGVDDQLLLDDIIDSMGVMRLVEFIEQRGGAKVPSQDVTVENFGTVGVLAAYVESRGMKLGGT